MKIDDPYRSHRDHEDINSSFVKSDKKEDLKESDNLYFKGLDRGMSEDVSCVKLILKTIVWKGNRLK